MYFLCYPQVVSSHAYSYGFICCLWDFFHHPNVIEVSGILFLVLTAGEEKTFSYGIFLKWKVIPVKTLRKNNRDTVSEKYNLLLLYCGGGWNLTRTEMGFNNLEPNPKMKCLQPVATTFKWKQATFCHLVFSSAAIVETFFFPTAHDKMQVSSFIYSIMEMWRQIETEPGCQPDWMASLASFSRESSCPMARKIAYWANLHADGVNILQPLLGAITTFLIMIH